MSTTIIEILVSFSIVSFCFCPIHYYSQGLIRYVQSVSGDVGGQIGLFVGASVLTIAHLLEYVFEELVRLARKVRRKRNERVLNQKKIYELAKPEQLMDKSRARLDPRQTFPASRHSDRRAVCAPMPTGRPRYDPTLFGAFCRGELRINGSFHDSPPRYSNARRPRAKSASRNCNTTMPTTTTTKKKNKSHKKRHDPPDYSQNNGAVPNYAEFRSTLV